MTTIVDLPSFVDALDETGQLARINRTVSLEYELADVAASLARTGTGAGLFNQVEGSPWPVFCGGVASHRRAAIAEAPASRRVYRCGVLVASVDHHGQIHRPD